ncbi:MAG TPA: hypothetical protein VE075_00960 [Thermoanaerobaculia bacterium]|nr:hypothetical protein [Thermoanaerobaculia bacterium]
MRTRTLLCLVAAGALLGLPALAEPAHPAPAAAAPAAFDHLKALAGNWQGKGSDGKTVRVSYEVDGAGSAVVEKLQPEGESAMVTVYHPDGSQVMLTHYCTLGNQPRMRTTSASGGQQLDFAFVDATNLKAPGDPHMQAVRFNFADADHFSQTWTMKHGDKEHTMTMSFERAR